MRKSSDEIIDQTLNGLRNTQPRESMEHRVLQALRTQPTPAPAGFAWSWPLATVAVTAMLAAILLTTFPHHPTPSNTAHTNNPTTNLSSQPEPQRSEGTAERPASSDRHEARTKPRAVEAKTRGVEASFSSPSRRTTEPGFSPGQSPEEAQLLDDLHAPSQPAPPLPLTRQERLLLRVVRKGEAVELAQLEPMREAALRAKAESNRKSAFVQYVQSFLAPMAQAERLNPTPADPEPEPQPDSTIAEQDPNQP